MLPKKKEFILKTIKKILTVVSIAALFVFAGCKSTQVQRVDPDKKVDLSGYWNDTDVRLVAQELIDSCLNSNAVKSFPAAHKGKAPVVIVGSFRNLSDEHIDTAIVTKQLEAALINSGKVDFVSAASEREEIRAERLDQQENSSEETAKALRNETGADFMLQGSIKTIIDSLDNKSTRTYYVTAELVDIETNKKLWMESNSSIKKAITRSKSKF